MQVIKLVNNLFEAYQDQTTLPQTSILKRITIAQAYHIQHAVTAKKVAAGERLAGYKICMTNQSCLDLFEAKEPIYGQMTSKQRLCGQSNDQSHPNHIKPPMLSLSRQVNDACIELHLAFIANDRLLASDTVQQLCDKCSVAPCLEISDSRYQDWFAKMSKEHLCADSAASGYVCIGEPKKVSYDEIAKFTGCLYQDKTLLSAEPASIVMKHPALALHWLVKKLNQQGLHISSEMYVASGAFGVPIPLTSGVFCAEMDGLGSVELNVRA